MKTRQKRFFPGFPRVVPDHLEADGFYLPEKLPAVFNDCTSTAITSLHQTKKNQNIYTVVPKSRKADDICLFFLTVIIVVLRFTNIVYTSSRRFGNMHI